MRRQYVSSLLVVGALASLAFFGAGCNPFQSAKDKISEKIGENVAEGLLGKATGGKVDISKGGNEVTYKDEKTGDTTAYGEDLKLPDDFPKSVLIYPGAKIGGVTMTKQGNPSAWIVISSADEPKQMVDWYTKETKAQGWTQESSMTIDKAEIRTYSKGNETLSMNIMPSDDATKGKTSAIITWEQTIPQPEDKSSAN